MHYFICVIFLCFTSFASFAQATKVKDTPEKTTILKVGGGSSLLFDAEITLSGFQGKSKKISGTVELDESKKIIKSAYIEIFVKNIKTGLKLRDKHMHKKYLEIKKFPKITFYSNKVQAYDLNKKFKYDGVWNVHGVKKKQSIEIEIKSSKFSTSKASKILEEIEIRGKFNMNILDFGIKQPKYLVVEMDPIIKVSLNLKFIKSK